MVQCLSRPPIPLTGPAQHPRPSSHPRTSIPRTAAAGHGMSTTDEPMAKTLRVLVLPWLSVVVLHRPCIVNAADPAHQPDPRPPSVLASRERVPPATAARHLRDSNNGLQVFYTAPRDQGALLKRPRTHRAPHTRCSQRPTSVEERHQANAVGEQATIALNEIISHGG